VLPRLGGLISGSYPAYRHLADSIGAFMDPDRLVKLLQASGFEEVKVEPLTLGVAGLFRARKP
jgi:demethylmenaquinone methyltransferase/2-methoxy-6-polyprenyl-1,4-benzoquinol methylase